MALTPRLPGAMQIRCLTFTPSPPAWSGIPCSRSIFSLIYISGKEVYLAMAAA